MAKSADFAGDKTNILPELCAMRAPAGANKKSPRCKAPQGRLAAAAYCGVILCGAQVRQNQPVRRTAKERLFDGPSS
jgi:hypothetical protein